MAGRRSQGTRATWRNRIIGDGEEAPDQLLANPRNWRVHPKAQQEALTGVLDEVGWVQRVIVNQRTGYVLDGHARVAMAITREEPTVPVVYVDLSPDEEALVLATYDPLGSLAVAGRESLDALLREVRSEQAPVQEMLANLAERAGLYGDADEASDDLGATDPELPGAFAIKNDVVWPSTLPFQIPALREDRLLDVPLPVSLWPGDDLGVPEFGGTFLVNYGTTNRRLPRARAVLAFYTDDARFESLWLKTDEWAGRLLNAGLLGAVTPNWSMWFNQPSAVHLWNTYRARWVGRHLQEAGIAVVPDANWSGPASFDFCLIGLPVEAPWLSVQLQTFRGRDAEEVERVRSGLLRVVAELRPRRLLVYAGAPGRRLVDECAEDLAGCERIVIATLMDHRREARKEHRAMRRLYFDKGFGGGGGGGGGSKGGGRAPFGSKGTTFGSGGGGGGSKGGGRAPFGSKGTTFGKGGRK